MNANVQIMNKFNKLNENFLEILRKISKKTHLSQREVSKDLGISLGKLNYCLKELRKKNYIKIKISKENKKNINYLYLLTDKGNEFKNKLTIEIMKKKMKEYEELKSEIDTSKTKKIDYDLL